jgi:hypothetical protein
MRLTTKSNGDLERNGRAEQTRFHKPLHRNENYILRLAKRYRSSTVDK